MISFWNQKHVQYGKQANNKKPKIPLAEFPSPHAFAKRIWRWLRQGEKFHQKATFVHLLNTPKTLLCG